MRIPIVMLALLTMLAGPAVAGANAPSGYDDCGYIDLATRTLTDEPEEGAVVRLYARNMSCPAALRNWKGIRYSSSAPYGPVRTGYRCKQIGGTADGATYRCTKRARSSVAFRWTSLA